ncbi:MAG TPA: hypothetical protein VGD58_00365 [Herpetosiphonaceae bacterium]
MRSYSSPASENSAGALAPGAQLNPFALPSETNTRFVLLVVAAIALALNLGFMLANRLQLPTLAALGELIEDASWMPDGSLGSYERHFAQNIDLMRQMLAILGFPVALTCAMLGFALWLYRTHPRRIRSNDTVARFEAAQDPRLDYTMRLLSTQAGVAQLPTVELEGGLRNDRFFVYGLPNRYILRVGRKWLLTLQKSPATFHSVFLHEMAHIVNRDVGRTYFSQALWVAIVAVVCVPVAVMIGLRFLVAEVDLARGMMQGLSGFEAMVQQFGKLLFLYLQIAITIAMVLAVRASFLRMREFYADWRVVFWGAWEPLADLIEGQPTNAPRKRWYEWLLRGYHPQPKNRLAALRESRHLFGPSFDLAFFVGFFLTLLLISCMMLVSLLILIMMTIAQLVISAALPSTASSWVVSAGHLALPLLVVGIVLVISGVLLGVGYLLSETLGLEVQRAALADLVIRPQRNRYRSLLGIALTAALGMELGIFFTPYAAFSRMPGSVILIALLYLGALTLLLWLWLVYVYKATQRLLGNHVGQAPPALKRALLSAILFGVGCVMLVPMVLSQYPGLLLLNRDSAIAWSLILGSVSAPLILALVIYVITALTTGLLYRLYRRSVPVRCSSCRHQFIGMFTLGKSCSACGSELSPWLFVNRSSEQTGQSQPAVFAEGWQFKLLRPVLWIVGLLLPVLVVSLLLIWLSPRFIGDPTDQNLTGSYQLQGADSQGGTYTGTLTIKRDGEVYALEWDTSAGAYTGTGILDRSVLTAVYGEPTICSGVSYRVDAQGTLHGLSVLHGGQQSFEEQAVPTAPETAGVEGVYTLSSSEPVTPPYAGTLTITETNSIYTLDWLTTTRAFTGTGIYAGDTIAAVSRDGKAGGCGIALYAIQANGDLDGQWTAFGGSEIGTERAFGKR